MPEQSSGQEGAAAAASTQPIELSKSTHAIDNQSPTKSSLKKQEIAALRRDFVAEALYVVSLKAGHASDDVLIGDDIAVERGISLTISHLKEAARIFRELRREAGQ
jgi:hypothetical protein